ncbi:MAG: hypothetical protein AAF652_12485 [Cyanobacteria bacterium P01_C01_bin.72]
MIPVQMQDNQKAIAAAFARLLDHYQQNQFKIATKEEEVAKSKNQMLLAQTRDYTVDNIVNGMASLQLNFSNVVGELAAELAHESHKQEELSQAVAIESEHLSRLKQVRLVADALYILNQEHQGKKASLEANTTQIIESINQEAADTKRKWEIEQANLATEIQEAAESKIRQRQLEAADYQYELERQRTIERDEYETNKRLQEMEIAELETAKNKDWSQREQQLQDKQAEFRQNQEAIAGFDAKLTEEYGKAKGKAIKDADSRYKVTADLREKEWSGIERGYELKINSLTAVVERQVEQITEITVQLQDANTQAQNLALQAFQNQ